MARISTYIKDTNLSNQDMVIGTDYDNNNQLTLQFSAPFAGKAYLN